ncbi:glycoside hydrolase family 76 protein [Lentinula aff. detonsa]|uniref:Glycoside hydrolase family 76 protein n=1 Tax=Lentinula aff. detonsa TaxID=2804958 RepID=A0AA38NMI3_9AGAR|nr:glycoside hydrolase family 76 protein [Lentinula aff. detonsa]
MQYSSLAQVLLFILAAILVVSEAATEFECPSTVALAFNEAHHYKDVDYDSATGSSINGSFWTDSNTMETLHLVMLQTGRSDFDGLADNSFLGRNALIPFTDWETFTGPFIDDAGWAVLALWTMADYKATHHQQNVDDFLTAAATVYDLIASNWDDTCGGGVWWTVDHTYKNAITNELFLTLSAQGYLRFKNDTYLENAKKAWAWIEGSGMRNAQGLYNDGLVFGTCVNNGETTWTYNQGVVLSGLGALYAATGNETLVSEAEITIDATIRNLTVNGILKESCDDVVLEGTPCDSDQGIWLKHLQYFLTFVHPTHPELVEKYQAFIGSQSEAVIRFATDLQLDIGSVWYGADAGGSIFSVQSLASGIMAHAANAEYGPCL